MTLLRFYSSPIIGLTIIIYIEEVKGAAVWLTVFWLVKTIFAPVFLAQAASLMGIAVFHSIFNILCTILMLPFSQALEHMVCRILPDAKAPEREKELDERLLASPALALGRCKQVLDLMAETAVAALKDSLESVIHYEEDRAENIRKAEDETDHLEDVIGTYLLKLTSRFDKVLDTLSGIAGEISVGYGGLFSGQGLLISEILIP